MAAGAVAPPVARPGVRLGRGTKIVTRVLAVLLGLLVPLLILEASLRLFGPWLPGYYETGLYIVREERLGHVHPPGYGGWMKTPEFTTRIDINQLGLRDRCTTYEKPLGTYRVLLLGDSFAEAIQVQQNEGIAERLEALLNVDSPRPVEVINAGVAAYGTAQELLYFEQEGFKFQPDLVVLMFYVGNDLRNNSYRLELEDRKLKLALKPYFDVDKQGRLELIPGPPVAPRDPVLAAFRDHSLLFNVIESSLYGSLSQETPREPIETVTPQHWPIRALFETDPDEEWLRAWRISEVLLATMKQRAAERGAPLVIVGVPDGRAMDEQGWRAEVAGRRLDQGRLDIDAPTNRLGEVAARIGVPYVNLLPALRQAVADGAGPVYYATDLHWNATGHSVAAQVVAGALVAEGLSGR